MGKEVKHEEEEEREVEEDQPLGWGWLDMEDPWIHQIFHMKLPLEEIEIRQQHKPPPPLALLLGRMSEVGAGGGGTVVQLAEPEGIEWTVLVCPKKGGPLRKVEFQGREENHECP